MNKKITSISIKNFQGYSNVKIPLKDFNIIIGKSSSGKSSIFRALRFLLYGEWDKTYPNNPNDYTAVGITTSNGAKIIRAKTSKENKALIEFNNEQNKYKSFGDVIPGIFEIINLKEVEINGKPININMSMQDDQLFMLAESKQTKANWLGRLYGAHIVSMAIKELTKNKNNYANEIRIIDDSVNKTKKELDGYETLPKQTELLEGIKLKVKELNKIIELKTELKLIKETGNDLKNKSKILNIDTNKMKLSVFRLAELKTIKNNLNELKEIKGKIQSKKQILSIDFKKMQNIYDRLNELKELKKEIVLYKSSVAEAKGKLAKVNSEIEILHSEISKIFKDGTCPICNSKTDIKIVDAVNNIRNILNKGI